MLGCYDFCAHYDWTFSWIERRYGKDALKTFWEKAIGFDSQQHALHLIKSSGFDGMQKYWDATLEEESPDKGYRTEKGEDYFSIEMTDCPSRGFLLRNKLEFSGDYCDHCIGWIGPVMKQAGFTINHAHNHKGQCVWVFSKDDSLNLKEFTYEHLWKMDENVYDAGSGPCIIDAYIRANSTEDKIRKRYPSED